MVHLFASISVRHYYIAPFIQFSRFTHSFGFPGIIHVCGGLCKFLAHLAGPGCWSDSIGRPANIDQRDPRRFSPNSFEDFLSNSLPPKTDCSLRRPQRSARTTCDVWPLRRPCPRALACASLVRHSCTRRAWDVAPSCGSVKG